MMTTDYKKRILNAIQEDRKNYPSDAKQSKALGINASQLARIKSGEIDRVLSDAKWITIAKKLDVTLKDAKVWNVAKTPVFSHIYAQLEACQKHSISSILCDDAGIGKTFTAKYYARNSKFAVCIDCSQVKTKQKLVRQIAKEFGLEHEGRYQEIYETLVFYINQIDSPLIILDEAGDLNYDAFLECKSLWNATERSCGWYMMGADGLRKKIENNKSRQKVGYAEIFDRYGRRFQRVTPQGQEEMEAFNKLQVAHVAKAQQSDINVNQLYAKTQGSLRRVYIELSK